MKKFGMKTRKAIALLLVFSMFTSFMGVSALADESEEGPVLTCGMEEHTHGADCYTLTCKLEESEGHTHTDECYTVEKTLTCGLEESEGHEHTEECCAEEELLTCGLEESEGHKHTEECYELTCEKAEHTHTEECYAKDSGIAAISLENESSDLRDFVTNVTITDKDGKDIDGKLEIGGEYKIHIEFSEGGDATKLQFDFNGDLTYQFPTLFDVKPTDGPVGFSVTIDGAPVKGTYTVDESGKLTVSFDDEGKAALKSAYNVNIYFDMEATANANGSADFGGNKFDAAGEDFTFEVTDQPRVKVEKNGVYTENEDHTGGTLSYTVKVTVEYGEIHDAMLKDVLTPPQYSAFSLSDPENVTVTLRQNGEEYTLTAGVDYELTETGDDPNHPGDKAFQVKIIETSAYDPLEEGDELCFTYTYKANVSNPNLHLWVNMKNVATFTGTMPVKDPSDPSNVENIHVEEEGTDSEEVFMTPTGHGVICKDQSYSEATKTLHYTLYTVVPAGKWTPLQIYDDMYVQYNGEKWYLKEFTTNGKVKNLTVKAVDVGEWFGDEDWADNTLASDKIKSFSELAENAKVLTGYSYNGWDVPSEYNSTSRENYLYYFANKSLYIIFGDAGETWGEWGSWYYNKDRLIITEYDLDMSATEPMTLYDIDDAGDIREKLALTPEEVLKAGITNNVNLRYGGYFPGYSVFFNNNETMTKTGELDKEKGTIDYTVTINTTDSTVKKYFQDVTTEWYGMGEECGWNFDNMYSRSMQAVFYDVLPAGWEYVKGSLYAVARGQYNMQEFNTLKCDSPLDQDENICVSLAAFQDKSNSKNTELLNWYVGDDMTSLEFHYTLKATDEWLKEYATANAPVPVNNHAEIKDKEIKHWSADKKIEYYPAKLTKKAEQVGETNLLKFTIKINPEAADYDPKNDHLIVNDESTNLYIQRDSIEVWSNGEKIEKGIEVTETSEGKLSIKVPDGMALTITYNAVIMDKGVNVPVSNKASIYGVTGSESEYGDSLNVNKIYGSGEGSSYQMTVRKTDSETGKPLAGAEFEYYQVLDASSVVTATKTISINGENYKVYAADSTWGGATGEDGTFTINHVSPNCYFVLVETKAPEGYQKLEQPILFFYGYKVDNKTYPDAIPVLGELDVPNTPIPKAALEVEKTIVGIDTTDKAFTFNLKNGEEVVDTVTVNGAGKANFKSISYTEPGSYSYTITETKGDDENWTYDETVWTVTVTVAMEGGKLTASAVYTKDGMTADHATFTNTYSPKGSLTITKKVVGGGDAVEGKTYTFTVTDESGTVVGTAAITGGGSCTIENLKPGTYTVTEADANIDGYTWEATGTGTVEVVADGTKNVTVTNTYTQKLGSLKITKKVEGNSEEAKTKTYTFTVTGPSYPGGKKISITGADSVILKDLVPGVYTVSEDQGEATIAGYTLEVTGDRTATVTYNHEATVTVTNTYTEHPGSLTVKKVVVGGGDEAESKVYTFTISGPANVTGTYSDVVFANGKATVTLMGGEFKTIDGLPTGNYNVTESRDDTAIANYTLSVTGEGTATVTRDGTAEVTVTNKYERDTGSLTVTKTVAGEVGKDNTYTFAIEGPADANGIYDDVVFANGKATVTVKGNESKTIHGLPTGNYTVTESRAGTEIANYALSVTGEGTATVTKDETAKVTVTNTYTQKLGSLTVTKKVVGGGDEAANKVYTFTVTGPSYPDGYDITVTGSNSVTLPNLVPGTYTVTEQDAGIEGYDLDVSVEGTGIVAYEDVANVTVTNTYTQKLGSLTVTKKVVGGGDEAANKVYTFTVTGPSYPEGYEVTVTGSNSVTLPNLVPGTYTVAEANADIDGYTWSVGGTGDVIVKAEKTAPVTVTNTYEPKPISIPVEKVWKNIDGSKATANLPESVTVYLYVNGVKSEKFVTLTAASGWKGAFENLPAKDADGNDITYTVDEVEIPGWTAAYANDGAKLTVTNTRNESEKTEISVEKLWQNSDGTEAAENLPASVTVTLLRNGEAAGQAILNAENGWAHTFTDLDKNDINGDAIVYTVQESPVDGWTLESLTGDAVDGFTVVNRRNKPGTIGLSVTKRFVEHDGVTAAVEDLPASVTVRLYENGKATETTVTLNAENNWSGSFNDLPLKDINGNDITYTLAEDKVPGWTAAYADDGASWSVTNTRDTISLTVNKVWADSSGGAMEAPAGASVTVRLFDGETELRSFELTAENGWTHTFAGLEPDGDYRVTEDAYSGFTTTVTVNEDGSVTVTNTQTPPPAPRVSYTSVSARKVWNDAGFEAQRPESVEVQLYRDGTAYGAAVTLSEANGWSYNWQLLDGDYTWTVGEVNAPAGYTSVVTGNGTEFVITNTYDIPEPELGSLTITKAVVGGGEEAAAKTYTFTVTGPEGFSRTVTVTGSGSVTLSALEPGRYTVTEADASMEGWTWTVSGQGEVTVTAGENAEATVTNTYIPDEPDMDIPDSDIPLTDIPTVDIPDENVPLDDLPETGDDSKRGLWLSLLAASFSGMIALFIYGRKGKNEEEEN